MGWPLRFVEAEAIAQESRLIPILYIGTRAQNYIFKRRKQVVWITNSLLSAV